ncbi:MFS transporter [Gryllotalpicola protaetiae]|uniref:MFS transporter n=1 Tax=Gryllotalpicola protaetiae TaxID=2419771 RepID=A0A387BWP9_9MICO|nr:MFS transporter [Gryllotalpicola protaetiae]AYG02751.1 MFS transporter [Gryllotalpicola protaetiae]
MSSAQRAAWLRPAVAIFIVGWGANMFVPMLDVYRGALSDVQVDGLFGAYALGLIPALLVVAPISDRWGRRAVLRPVVLLSAVGSLLLMLAGDSFTGLLIGRIVVGVAAGAAFGPGTAWVKELSERDGRGAAGARRAAIALTAGFAVGPLISGILAQWLPLPERTPYAVQIVLALVVAAYVWITPETVDSARRPSGPGGERGRLGAALSGRVFLAAILPTAPWVFGAASASLAALPAQVKLDGFDEVASGVVAIVTLGTGILIQPWARSLAQRSRPAPFRVGMGAAVLGLLLGAATAATHSALLLAPTAVALGAAYGLLLVSGLGVVEELAPPGALAALTGIFYSVTYVGFAFPLLDSLFAPVVTGPGAFLIAAAIAGAAFFGLAVAWKPRRAARE